MERIVFPIPEICEYLTKETKNSIFKLAERDEQGSKVADFFNKHNEMFNEMKWQKKLRSEWQPFCQVMYENYQSTHSSNGITKWT